MKTNPLAKLSVRIILVAFSLSLLFTAGCASTSETTTDSYGFHSADNQTPDSKAWDGCLDAFGPFFYRP